MPLSPIDRIRRFNRSVTAEVGALDSSFLGRGRPLGAARVLWSITPDGTDVADVRQQLRLDSGLMSRLLRGLEADLVDGWMDKGWTAVMAHWPHPDAMEGPVAFSEKRDPIWNPDWTES